MADNGETLRLSRVSRLIGREATDTLGKKKVILFGLGGVGSWAAESLVRSGIRQLTIVDADTVAESNINRQLPAMTSTVGKSKVEVMRDRLLDIAPDADIRVVNGRYDKATAEDFDLDSYDYTIDAIDSLADKALLILRATSSRTRFYSSMGAALKLDPSRIQIAEFWKVKGCPLAAALRRRFKKSGLLPRRKFKCVFSDELVHNRGEEMADGGAMSFDKVAFNGALCHITAIFGMMLASLVVNDVIRQTSFCAAENNPEGC